MGKEIVANFLWEASLRPGITKGFCVHGHFYQPPREDPLTGVIPREPGAYPYPNWNVRIHEECYKPNSEVRNFERISFNMGPTLLSWMAEYDPDTLAGIVEQDRTLERTHGVGNGMAQAYHHTILPLATREDKETQIRWGIGDFEYHFGHKPSGIWLPEAAVDLETLEVCANCGIEFTILAPWQAKSGEQELLEQPARVVLANGKSISVFFYEQDLSTRVSFDPGSTMNADQFVNDRILPKYNGMKPGDHKLLIIASDGELYGHHQKFRDKFLQRLMNHSLEGKMVEWTYPGLWLRRFPPTRTVEIHENTSWSCMHGVARWREDCTCTPGSMWKAPLRSALDRLARWLNDVYIERVTRLGIDPWELRNTYIHVINREVTVRELIDSAAGRKLAMDESQTVELLLRSQYERQRIFTSCGWFFDEFDRIEPRNVLAYAAQAVWLVRLASGVDLAEKTANLLQQVRSGRTGLRADSVFYFHLNRAEGKM